MYRRSPRTQLLLVMPLCVATLSSWACQPRSEDGLHDRSRPVLSPSGDIFVSIRRSGRSEIYRTNGETLAKVSVTPGIDAVDGTLVPNGTMMAFVRLEADGTGAIWGGDLKKQDFRRLTPLNSNQEMMEALPIFLSADKVVFFRSTTTRTTSTFGKTWTDWRLYLLDLESGRVNLLTDESFISISGIDSCASASFILAGVRTEGQSRVSAFATTADIESSRRSWRDTTQPAFRPDCKAFFSISQRGTNEDTGHYAYELMLNDLVSGSTAQITKLGSYVASPAVSLDGRTIVFLSDPERDDVYDLVTMDLTTLQPKVLMRF